MNDYAVDESWAVVGQELLKRASGEHSCNFAVHVDFADSDDDFPGSLGIAPEEIFKLIPRRRKRAQTLVSDIPATVGDPLLRKSIGFAHKSAQRGLSITRRVSAKPTVVAFIDEFGSNGTSSMR